jgi:hypothetical protein
MCPGLLVSLRANSSCFITWSHFSGDSHNFIIVGESDFNITTYISLYINRHSSSQLSTIFGHSFSCSLARPIHLCFSFTHTDVSRFIHFSTFSTFSIKKISQLLPCCIAQFVCSYMRFLSQYDTSNLLIFHVFFGNMRGKY